MMFGMDSFNYGPNLVFNTDTAQNQNDPSFQNTESWVKNSFINHYDTCFGVVYGGDDWTYKIQQVQGITQRKAPSGNDTEWQWDVKYTWEKSDGSEQGEDCHTFAYKENGEYSYSNTNSSFCNTYFATGRAQSCLVSGTGWTPLVAGDTAADTFLLKTNYACPGQSSTKYHAKLYHNAKTGEWKVEKFPCDPWSSNSIGYQIFSDKKTAEAAINTEWSGIWDDSEYQEKIAIKEVERLAKKKADRLAKKEEDRLAQLEKDRLAQLEKDRLAQLALVSGGVIIQPDNKKLISLIAGGGIILAIVVMIA